MTYIRKLESDWEGDTIKFINLPWHLIHSIIYEHKNYIQQDAFYKCLGILLTTVHPPAAKQVETNLCAPKQNYTRKDRYVGSVVQGHRVAQGPRWMGREI